MSVRRLTGQGKLPVMGSSMSLTDSSGISLSRTERVFASGASKYAFTTLSHTLCSLLIVASKNQWPRPSAPRLIEAVFRLYWP